MATKLSILSKQLGWSSCYRADHGDVFTKWGIPSNRLTNDLLVVCIPAVFCLLVSSLLPMRLAVEHVDLAQQEGTESGQFW